MDSIRNALTGAQQFFHNAATNTRDRIVAVEWEQLPRQTQDYITHHPYQTAFYVANGVVFAAPIVLAGPLLGAAGFTAAGPAAGSLAAGAQGASVAAGSLFATLQSAAMGGYGTAAVGGVVQAGAAVVTGVVGTWNFYRGRRDGDGGNDNVGNDNDDNDKSGNDKSGNDKSGNDKSGNDKSGNDKSGNDKSGNDKSGNDNNGDQDDPGQGGQGVHKARL